MAMKKWQVGCLWVLGVCAALTLVGGGIAWKAGTWWTSTYDNIVVKQQSKNETRANYHAALQRRWNLVPNLVAAVKGSMKFEKETLTAIIEARAKATSITIDPKNMSADDMKNLQVAEKEFSGALSRLLVTVEKYPELKSSERVADLMVQLEGSENQINTALVRDNAAAGAYNASIKGFMPSFVADHYGFEEVSFFESDKEAKVAPTVSLE